MQPPAAPTRADPDEPGAAADQPEAGARGGSDEAAGAAAGAFYLYGVTRSRGWRSGPRQEADGLDRLRYRGLEALTRTTVFRTPELDDAAVLAHQRVLDAALRRGTVLPAPFGIVFRSRRHVLRMLQEQYTVLSDGLDFLDGHWELRIHILPADGGAGSAPLHDLALQVYTELRRGARAGVPIPGEDERRLLSAAFLVERAGWLDFMHRADDLGSQHPELSLDITGPWPAYDFVRLSR